MGWVSLRLWSFSPGKVVRPGCLFWSRSAPPLILYTLCLVTYDYLNWCTPVMSDLFIKVLLLDFLG